MAKEKISAQQEKIEATVSKAEKFYIENKKTIWGAAIAIVLAGLCILGYNKFIFQPKQAEALGQMFHAEASFRAADYEIALNGDGNNLGFAEIISEYGNKAGKAVFFYAGICEMQLGNFDEAISYLKKYSGKDAILAARAQACLGDCYVNKEMYETAVAHFIKAADMADNVFAAGYLLKAGAVFEKLGDNAKALDCYKTIKNNYPQSMEGYEIDKYISRIETE